jgi:hypothetical protein
MTFTRAMFENRLCKKLELGDMQLAKQVEHACQRYTHPERVSKRLMLMPTKTG